MATHGSLITPEARAQLGKKTPWWDPPEPVTAPQVRLFAEASFNPNPVHYSGNGRDYRDPAITAPPTYVIRPPYGGNPIVGPGLWSLRVVLPGAPRRINGGNRLDVFRPVRVGDLVRQRARIADIQEKTGRSGAFVVQSVETLYADAHGEPLAISTQQYLHLPPSGGGQERSRPAPTGIPDSSLKDGHHAGANVEYGAKPLEFDEVQVGAQLPANRYGIVDSEVQVRFSAAVENWEALHHDFLWCREQGFANVLISGPIKQAFLGTYLEQLAGDRGFVRRLEASHRAMDYPGDRLSACATVTRKEVGPDGVGQVDLDVWVENQRGERSCLGAATLLLPRRGGPRAPQSVPCPRELIAWAFED